MLVEQEFADKVLGEMERCQQDPYFHAEGNLAVHTRSVMEALDTFPEVRELPVNDRALLMTAALLHDLGKLACTAVEPDGRITSHGHSRRGASMARRALYVAGVNPVVREEIVGLTRAHQIPFWALEDASELKISRASLSCRLPLLYLLAKADGKGRKVKGAESARLVDDVELFPERCSELGCWEGPRRFSSDLALYIYFASRGEKPANYVPYDDTRCEVVLISGFPGAGKDTWIKKNLPDWPVISLDEVREEIGVESGKDQGPVVQRAKEMAREHLRAHRSFVLNATHLIPSLRGQWIGLAVKYKARVRIVYLEVSLETLLKRNRTRPDGDRVAEPVIRTMIQRWETPERIEAHKVEYFFGV